MRIFAVARVFTLVLTLAACAGIPPAPAWQARLRGDAIVLLGEVHDNAEQHRERLTLLRRALQSGWRPALAMEQFDVDRQSDIDRARRDRPNDADHLFSQAMSPASGWDSRYYQPYVALALEFDLPLVAANLSRAEASRLVRADYATVFASDRLRSLKLDQPVDPAWEAAQRREVDLGHCGALPPAALPGMARAQFARDAVMAELLRRHGERGGVVLLAGNGHVRRDIGVPRWLDGAAASRLLSVGFLEEGDAHMPHAAFDAVVVTPRARRSDPCAQFISKPGNFGGAGPPRTSPRNAVRALIDSQSP